MAIVQFTPIVDAISGTYGSTVFRHGSQPSIAALTPQSSAPSPLQALCRSRFATCMDAWLSSGRLVHRAWQAAAANLIRSNRVGLPTTYTGKDLYLAVNIRRLNDGYPLLTFPPNNPIGPAPYAWFPDFRQSFGYYADFSLCPAKSLEWFRIFGCRPHHSNPRTTWPCWRWLLTSRCKLPAVEITAQFKAALGEPQIGEQVLVAVEGFNLVGLPTARITRVATIVP